MTRRTGCTKTTDVLCYKYVCFNTTRKRATEVNEHLMKLIPTYYFNAFDCSIGYVAFDVQNCNFVRVVFFFSKIYVFISIQVRKKEGEREIIRER